MMSFFNYKLGSKKGYMDREENFYFEIHMKCARQVHYTLLFQRFNTYFKELRLNTSSYWNKLLRKKLFWHKYLLKKLNSLEWLGNGLKYFWIVAYLNKISIKSFIKTKKGHCYQLTSVLGKGIAVATLFSWNCYMQKE